MNFQVHPFDLHGLVSQPPQNTDSLSSENMPADSVSDRPPTDQADISQEIADDNGSIPLYVAFILGQLGIYALSSVVTQLCNIVMLIAHFHHKTPED
ncbi:MAG: hypothetical protein AAFW75_07615 [Cyanobacteria bacterium J06636_16]